MLKHLTFSRLCFLLILLCAMAATARIAVIGWQSSRRAHAIAAQLSPEVLPENLGAGMPSTNPADMFIASAHRAMREKRDEQLADIRQLNMRAAYLLAVATVMAITWVLIALRIWRSDWLSNSRS